MKSFVETAKSGESTETILWDEIEPETAACLVEFAYTGDFGSPGFRKMTTGQVVENYRKLHTRPVFGSSKVLEWAWEKFVTKSWDYDGTQMLYDIDPDSNKSDALSTVAEVYELAYKYGIQDLKTLSLNKLHRLMVCFQDKVDVVDFLWFCACDECPRELFHLAVKYAVLMTGLSKSKGSFQDLMPEHPDFVEACCWWQAVILRQYA